MPGQVMGGTTVNGDGDGALLAVLRGRGWLNLALVRALLGDPQFAGLGELLRLEQVGALLRRQLPGLLLFRPAASGVPGGGGGCARCNGTAGATTPAVGSPNHRGSAVPPKGNGCRPPERIDYDGHTSSQAAPAQR